MFKNKNMLIVTLVAFSALTLWAAPSITTVTKNADPVGKYVKLELTVGLTATYTNPYDPAQIDLWTEFTSPTNKLWRVNGFYNGTQWKVRFAANETGTWSYVVKATDATGSGQSSAGSFSCVASNYHGWVKIGPNKRYLCYDDGTSFYGVGSCHAWSVTTSTLDQMQAIGFNTYVYWNGTYDQSGGNNLIESNASGMGRYDQGKCTRIDSLINWSEARGLTMILVVWPHDYLAQNIGGSWVKAWSSNPYNTICTAANFYSDANAWTYQTKQYRYIIARWGYSRGLSGWQTVDEISGTDGWSNQTAANAWTTNIATYFQTNDPFRHPTTASHGDYWPHGDSVNDLSNTENYGSTTPASTASLVQTLWNGYLKPAIAGEYTTTNAHTNLWASLSNGIAITPLMWQFNQGWSSAISANFPPLENFIAGINFANLTGLALASVTVTGATAYGITSNQLTFGWITGTISGRNLSVTGLANGSYSLEWWDCTAGTTISTSAVSVTTGSLTTTVPTTSQTDMAFKIISPTKVIAQSSRQRTDFRPVIAYKQGALRLLEPMAENSMIDIITALGRVVVHCKVTGANATSVPVGRLGRGVYFARIMSGDKNALQRLLVND